MNVLARYRLTQQAEEQLLDILGYSIAGFGENQAEKYHAELLRCFQLLADNPGLGRSAERVGTGRRRHVHGPHVIIYVPEPMGIRIIAIFHMSSDWRLPDTDAP